MKLTLHVWRQRDAGSPGRMETYPAADVSPDMSFLEMLDTVNEGLIHAGGDPIAFDHDCREGICGSCAMMINGMAHGPEKGTTACQLHMRKFKTGDTITVEPWRAGAFPLNKDLSVDRSALVTVQTPQAFHALPLLEAYERAATAGFVGSDTAACAERFGDLQVRSVAGDPRNLKITFPEDLFVAERLLAKAHWKLT